jgi:cytochrome c-type biogenesis protein CcmH/NrfG
MTTPDPSEKQVQAIMQTMRETYVMLGKSLIPMLGNTPEDIQTLLELGEVYVTLGCVREAIATYERARQLSPDCLPESARAFLIAHSGLVV